MEVGLLDPQDTLLVPHDVLVLLLFLLVGLGLHCQDICLGVQLWIVYFYLDQPLLL